MESDSLQLYTSSQDSMIMSEVRELQRDLHLSDLDQLFETPDQLEVKYDISQSMVVPPPHEQQQQPLILPIEHFPLAQMHTSEEFQGEFNFQLTPDQQEDTKSWTYSPKMNKVFIEIDKTLPVRVKWTPQTCNGLFIRAGMAFCQPTHRSDPVTRCHNHAAVSKQGSRHVLSCKDTNAYYSEANGHHFVRVPLSTPQPGSDSVQMDFMFHCKNSCSTGINRRPTEVVFNLENKLGVVLGCSKLFVRICSCPKRDRDKEEKPMRENPAAKKRKLNSGKKCMPIYREQPQLETDSDIFTFSARIYGRENFETLKRLAYGLMVETMDRTGQQAVIKPLLDELNRMR